MSEIWVATDHKRHSFDHGIESQTRKFFRPSKKKCTVKYILKCATLVVMKPPVSFCIQQSVVLLTSHPQQ